MLQAEGTEVNSKEMLAKSTFTEMDKNGDGKVKPAKQRQRQKPQRKNLHRDGPDGQVRTLHLQYHLYSVESTPYSCHMLSLRGWV